MLILKHHGLPLHDVAEGGWFELPDGAICSPAYAGWADENGHSLEVAPDPAPYVATLAEKRAAASLPAGFAKSRTAITVSPGHAFQ